MHSDLDLKKIQKVYCIGIGGIGLSAVARYFLHHQAVVAGSDISAEGLVIDLLQKDGISKIFRNHIAENIFEFFQKEIQENEEIKETEEKIKENKNFSQNLAADNSGNNLVIYTIAIDKNSNQEFLEAKRLGLTTLSYPEVLGLITKKYQTIAVCGTHGKTTTTAMTYFALKEAGIQANVIVGSLIKNELGQQTNFINGQPDKNGQEYLIVEACEYQRSFLNLWPQYILITNIEADHLDYYKDLADIQDAFLTFRNKTNVQKVFEHDESDNNISKIDLTVLGQHNQENAKLVLKLGQHLNLNEEKLRAGLKKFTGTWRRMEFKGEISLENNIVQIYDDYGHHPTEIKATLSALREKYVTENLIIVFQPHLYSRTQIFLQEFSESFDLADKVFILPIYAAREKFNPNISSQILVDKINQIQNQKAEFVQDFSEAKEKVLEYFEKLNSEPKNLKENLLLLTIGAGQAYKVGEMILNQFQTFDL